MEHSRFSTSLIDGKEVLVDSRVTNKRRYDTAACTITVEAPRHVYRLDTGLVIQAIELASEVKPVRVIDAGVMQNADLNKTLVYVVLSDPQIAHSIAKRYRLEVRISRSTAQTCMTRIKLMGDSAVNIRLDKVPPSADEVDVYKYALQFGDVKLVEQLTIKDSDILTDSWVCVVIPPSRQFLYNEQQTPHRVMQVHGDNFLIRYYCESIPSFCNTCKEFGHYAGRCSKRGECLLCSQPGHKARNCPAASRLACVGSPPAGPETRRADDYHARPTSPTQHGISAIQVENPETTSHLSPEQSESDSDNDASGGSADEGGDVAFEEPPPALTPLEATLTLCSLSAPRFKKYIPSVAPCVSCGELVRDHSYDIASKTAFLDRHWACVAEDLGPLVLMCKTETRCSVHGSTQSGFY